MNKTILTHFKKSDLVLYSIAKIYSDISLESNSDTFFSLVESIISQQLSVKAGDTIVKRFVSLVGEPVTPEAVLKTSREQLRAVGMSWSKADYVHNIARAVVEKTIDLTALDSMTNEEVIRELTKIKGIGQWTAEMFLMFTLAREDVFSHGDVGLQNAMQKLYNLESKPTKEQMETISTKWKPYRTYAARVLWESLDNLPKASGTTLLSQ